jgi:hypothetical protein
MAYYDIKAAYPSALSSAPVPLTYHKVNPDTWRQYPDGFSRATAFIPYDSPFPHPLPIHLKPNNTHKRKTWGTGAFSGWWSHRDMLAADDIGAIVRVEETWAPQTVTETFMADEWQAMRHQLRTLPGPAAALGKSADNALWGMFAYNAIDKRGIRWSTRDGDPTKVTYTSSGVSFRKVHGFSIALTATARVRETLYKGITQTGAIYCDTDGIIAPKGLQPTPYLGDEGSWVVKHLYPDLEIKAPQIYRWIHPNDTDWRYFGETSRRHFEAAPIRKGRLHGDDMGNAAPLSVKQAHLLRFIDA